MVKGGEQIEEGKLGAKEDAWLKRGRWKESLKNDQAPSIKKIEEKSPRAQAKRRSIQEDFKTCPA